MRAFTFQQRHSKLPSAYLSVSELPERPNYDKRGLLNLLLKSDKGDSEIAEQTGYSISHVARMRRAYGGLKRVVEHRGPEDVRKVRSLCEDGKTVEEIVNDTGFSTSFVSKSTIDLRLLRAPKKLKACADRAGMGSFAYVTLRRMEVMLRMGEIKEWDFNEAKKRLPSGDITPQQIEWMLKTGRVINICPSGEKLSAVNKKAYAKQQEEAKKSKFLARRRFNQWRK